MPTATFVLDELVSQLGFTAYDPETACGEIRGFPVTLTIVGLESVGLMFEFRIAEATGDAEPKLDLPFELPEELLKISFGKERAWLSIYDLSGATPDAVRLLVEQFAGAVAAAGRAPSPGCSQCGAIAGAEVRCLDGDTVRICPQCLEGIYAERDERQRQLDRPSRLALLGLPAVFTVAATGWAVFWTLVDLAIEWLQIDVVEINRLTVMILLVVAGGAGAAMGLPLGTALRQSGAVRLAPRVLSGLVVLGAVIVGEIGYIALLLFRFVGVFDLGLAAQFLPNILPLYGSFIAACKLILALTVGGFCMASVTERPVARLEI